MSPATEFTASTDKAVETHLKRLLGDLYVAYQYASSETKHEVLFATLSHRLGLLTAEATKSPAVVTRIDLEQLEKLPPEIR